nr:P-loop NTPase fold protein [uncultured Desulfuromonas sp.]
MQNRKKLETWKNDKLRRKEEADFLTKYLIGKSKTENTTMNNGSFVLNINAEWGQGKTYFLKNWADELLNSGYPVIYFDAWQNDFSKEPLIAFIATINNQLEPYFNHKIGKIRGKKIKLLMNNWNKSARKLVQVSSPLLLEALVKKITAMSCDQISELLESPTGELVISEDGVNDPSNDEQNETISSVVSRAASKMLKSHNETQATILEFKDRLEKLTKHLETIKTIKTPLFIFVDELDRCRPNYAIELLETIKHLFGVRNVYFVVATASDQLCHSIKRVYGEGFDSQKYLKRFFDQTYIFREPDRREFAWYLFEKYALSNRDNLYTPLEEEFYIGVNTRVETFASFANQLNLSLRDMIQYCIIIDSITITSEKTIIHLPYIIFIIWVMENNNQLYQNICNELFIDTETIKKLVGGNVSFLSNIYSAFNRKETTHIKLYEIIDKYIRFSRVGEDSLVQESSGGKVKTIFSTIAKKLLEDIRADRSSYVERSNSLVFYPQLVEQAGRLS